jgi:hypothetical protein
MNAPLINFSGVFFLNHRHIIFSKFYNSLYQE